MSDISDCLQRFKHSLALDAENELRFFAPIISHSVQLIDDSFRWEFCFPAKGELPIFQLKVTKTVGNLIYYSTEHIKAAALINFNGSLGMPLGRKASASALRLKHILATHQVEEEN